MILKKGLWCVFFISWLFVPMFSADPFYTNLLNEGKQQFTAGKYDEALDSFKLAEFGLLDDKEYVAELYYFFALTKYRKGAIGETKTLLDKMNSVLGDDVVKKAKKPKEIERDISYMTRALNFLDQPGARPGMLPFLNLFYETWDLLRAKQLPEAEAKIKILAKMSGDGTRLRFLEGYLAFQKDDYKRSLGRLEKINGPLPEEIGEDASFMLTYSYLKQGKLKEGEKWAQKIMNPEHIHQIMDLMEEIKSLKK